MRLNRRFFTVVALTVLVAASLSAFVLKSARTIPILMYHSIDYTQDRENRLVVSPQVFSRQVEYLERHGYDVIPASEAVAMMRGRKPPPAKKVVITIDDAYYDNYKYVWPVLKRFNAPAIIFVPVDMVGKPGFMSWAQIKELSDSGLVDIGSHTLSHRWLTGLDEKELEKELTESKRILEMKLGRPIKFLCYPMGGYNESVKTAARAAGYEAAFATKPRTLFPKYDLYAIERIRISKTSDNMSVFMIKISGYYPFFRVLQREAGEMVPDVIRYQQ